MARQTRRFHAGMHKDPPRDLPGRAAEEPTMKSRATVACMVMMGLAASPVMAQTADDSGAPLMEPPTAATRAAPDREPPVLQYDLNGPRIGVTFNPLGTRSQFGWHFENQASPGTRGPWFLVERILLIGGVERGEFIPSGTLIFGVRTPSSSEVGVGPSLTIGPGGITTAIVVAGGQTLHYGGVRVPINVALAISQREHVNSVLVTLITGWAIRQHEYEPASRPYRYGVEK
jgi:hypothetical protein